MTEEKQKKATDAVLETMEQPEEAAPDIDPNLIELSTGVVLRAKPMPPGLFMKLSAALPRPETPKFQPEGKKFWVQDHDNEDYVAQVKLWEDEKKSLMLEGMIAYGTAYESGPPEWKKQKPPYTDDDWIDKLVALSDKLNVKPENKHWRYLTWIMSVACETADDYEDIFRKVGRLSGVPEEDIQKAGNFSERN